MKFVKAAVFFLVAVGFVAAASLARPKVERSLGKKPKEAEKKDKGLKIRFGYNQKIPKVTTTKPKISAISQHVAAPGSLSPGSEVGIGAPFAGTVLGLAVDEGDRVKKGDLVFALDPTENKEAVEEAKKTLLLKQAAIEEAEAELAEAKAKLSERLEKGEEPSAVKEARLALRKSLISFEQSQARLENAQSKAKRSRLLFKKGLGTEVEVEASESELRVAKLTLKISEKDQQLSKDTLKLRIEEAQKELRELKKAKCLADIRLSRAKIDKQMAQLTLQKAKRDLEKTRVLSPMTGIITQRNINSGEAVSRVDTSSAATTHYIISDFSRMLVYADVDEGDIVLVREKQAVRVRVAALGDDTVLKGKVYDIRNRAAVSGETSSFRVRVLISKAPESLRPGMTANVEIETKRVDDVLTVPIQAIGQRRRRDIKKELLEDSEGKPNDTLDVVFVFDGGKAKMKIIELGISDEDNIEIKKGLEQEDQVITGPYRVLESLHHDDPVDLDVSAKKRGKGKGKGRKKRSGSKDKGEGKDS